jgi:hypothetical protein
MIGHKKGEDINDAIKGPIGYFGLGILIIGASFAFANSWSSDAAPPDEPILFGGFIVDIISEMTYYANVLIPLIIVVGGALVGLQLRIHPNKTSKLP